MRFLYTILFTAIICLPALATIINIPDDYETIQEGIDASTDGDTVLVQPGTYVENINFNGHNIVLGSLFLTTGDTTYIAETTIDGDQAGTVVSFENGENSPASIVGFSVEDGYTGELGGGIRCINNSNPTISHNIISENICWYYGGGIYCDRSSPIISNNLITQNNALYGAGIFCSLNSSPTITGNTISENEVYYDGRGGGVYCWNQSSPIITNNTISGNHGDWGGGGIRCLGQSNAIIANNLISGNSGAEGGAINCQSSSPLIIDNTIQGNIGGSTGAGIFCIHANALIYNNDIKENYSYCNGGGIACFQSDPLIAYNDIAENFMVDLHNNTRGGGIYCVDSDPAIHNNVISANSANFGAGLYCVRSNPAISNNSITGNSADSTGGGIYCWSSNPTIINTILWADSSQYFYEIFADTSSSMTIIYSDIQDTLWPGEGNISIDPLFRNPAGGDYHLMSTACGDPYDSPCIDVGHPDIIDSLLDCSWGLGTILSDMGAYGGGDSATVGIIDQQPRIPDRFFLMQNYPNPFNARTVIRYSLPAESDITIEIFDILGRKVEMLVNQKQPAGYHQAIWNAIDRPSGIYFYRIRAGEHSETRKMLLIR